MEYTFYLIKDDMVNYDLTIPEICRVLNISSENFVKLIRNNKPNEIIEFNKYGIIYTDKN